MKLKHLITGTIITLSILAASAITSLAAVPKARFEKITDSAITGWGYDKDLPNSAINVTVAVKNKATGEEVFRQKVSAGEYNEKLYDEGKGDGCHGFTVNMDWSSYPDGEYLIEGYVGDSDFSNSRTYKKGAETAPAQAAAAPKLVPLGTFLTTGYCPCRSCSDGWGRLTSTGAIAAANHTIAVDPRVIPYGSKIMINGVVYTAEDTGSAVKGNHIDIFFNTHREAMQHGMQNAEAFLVQDN